MGGAALMGRTAEIRGMIATHVLCLPIVAAALYLLFRPVRRTEQTKGRVSGPPICTRAWIVTTNCSCSVTFTGVRDQREHIHHAKLNRTVTAGEAVDVWYDPDNPADADVSPPSRFLGWMLLIPFGGYLIYRWLRMWLVFNFRRFAAFKGLMRGMGLVRGL